MAAVVVALSRHSAALLPVYRVLCDDLCGLVQLAISLIDGLMESNAQLTTECRAVYECISRAVTAGFNYIDRMNDFVNCAQMEDEINDIKARVRQGDFRPLQYLVFRLRQHLTRAASLYDEFQTACDEAGTRCNQASQQSLLNRSRACFGRRAVQVGGGTAAAGLIAGGATAGVAVGGVALSAVAGIFTFGVGTIVGLAITAGATATAGAVAGTGAAVGTAVAAKHLKKMSENFGKLATAFNALSGHSSQLHNSVAKAESQLQRAAEELENVDYCCDHQLLEEICTALDNLHDSCEGLYPVISSLRENLREADSQLRAKLVELDHRT